METAIMNAMDAMAGSQASAYLTIEGTRYCFMRKYFLEYKKTGRLPSFDIQVTNEDQSTSLGRQTIILKNCLAKGGILAKYDAGAEILDEEIEGTFDDWEMPETFSLLEGMSS